MIEINASFFLETSLTFLQTVVNILQKHSSTIHQTSKSRTRLHTRRYIHTIKQLLLIRRSNISYRLSFPQTNSGIWPRFNNNASESTICQSSRPFTSSISSRGSTNSKDLPLIHEIKTSSHFVYSISNKTQRENSKTYNLL